MEIINKKIEVFKQRMLLELKNNSHKKCILDFSDYESIITEIEYHKAKLLIAIRVGNKHAAKEYIADVANFLFALGNSNGLYDDDFEDIFETNSFEIIKSDVFIEVTKSSLFNSKF